MKPTLPAPSSSFLVAVTLCLIAMGSPALVGEDLLSIPTVDLSGETERHSFVARGTKDQYQGHVDTVLLPDGGFKFSQYAIQRLLFHDQCRRLLKQLFERNRSLI